MLSKHHWEDTSRSELISIIERSREHITDMLKGWAVLASDIENCCGVAPSSDSMNLSSDRAFEFLVALDNGYPIDNT